MLKGTCTLLTPAKKCNPLCDSLLLQLTKYKCENPHNIMVSLVMVKIYYHRGLEKHVDMYFPKKYKWQMEKCLTSPTFVNKLKFVNYINL